jgi:hypothetical protein
MILRHLQSIRGQGDIADGSSEKQEIAPMKLYQSGRITQAVASIVLHPVNLFVAHRLSEVFSEKVLFAYGGAALVGLIVGALFGFRPLMFSLIGGIYALFVFMPLMLVSHGFALLKFHYVLAYPLLAAFGTVAGWVSVGRSIPHRVDKND